MDADTRQKLVGIGLHIEDIGKQVASPRACAESVELMRGCLLRVAEMLDTTMDIQNVRDIISLRTQEASGRHLEVVA